MQKKLTPENCVYYFLKNDKNFPVTVHDINTKFESLIAYNHFAANVPIIFAKGQVSSTTAYGPKTVFQKHPWLANVHRYVVQNFLPNNADIVCLKFLKHDGSMGTKNYPINLKMNKEEDDDAYVAKANATMKHHDYMVLRTGTSTVVGVDGLQNVFNIEGTQQQKGRNGTLIVNLGGARDFQLETVVQVGDVPAKSTTTIRLVHSSVMNFGVPLNSVATHSVLGGGMGKRLSLVYEYALLAETFTSVEDEIKFFDNSWSNTKFTRYNIVPDINIKQENSRRGTNRA